MLLASRPPETGSNASPRVARAEGGDVVSDLAQGRGDETEETGRLRHRVARHVPDGGRLAQPETRQQPLAHLRAAPAEGRQGPHRAAELAHEDARAQLFQALDVAADRRQPARDLGAERERQGVAAEGARRHRRVPVPRRQAGEVAGQALQIPLDVVEGVAELHRQRRVHDVLRGAAPVDELPQAAAAGRRELARQRRDRIPGPPRVGGEPLDVDGLGRGDSRDLPRRLLGYQAELGLDPGERRLEGQIALEASPPRRRSPRGG